MIDSFIKKYSNSSLLRLNSLKNYKNISHYYYDQRRHTEHKHDSIALIATSKKTTRSDYITIRDVIQKCMLIYAVSQQLFTYIYNIELEILQLQG